MKSKDLDGARRKSLKELEEMVIKLEGDKIKEISNKMSAKSKNLNVRIRGQKEVATVNRKKFIEQVAKEIKEKK